MNIKLKPIPNQQKAEELSKLLEEIENSLREDYNLKYNYLVS